MGGQGYCWTKNSVMDGAVAAAAGGCGEAEGFHDGAEHAFVLIESAEIWV